MIWSPRLKIWHQTCFLSLEDFKTDYRKWQRMQMLQLCQQNKTWAQSVNFYIKQRRGKIMGQAPGDRGWGHRPVLCSAWSAGHGAGRHVPVQRRLKDPSGKKIGSMSWGRLGKSPNEKSPRCPPNFRSNLTTLSRAMFSSSVARYQNHSSPIFEFRNSCVA